MARLRLAKLNVKMRRVTWVADESFKIDYLWFVHLKQECSF
jgi:hypothetical protein